MRGPGIVASSLVACAIALGCRKPTLDDPKIGARSGKGAELSVASKVASAPMLGCEVRYENLPARSQIKVEWRWRQNDTSQNEWKTSKRETVEGTGNGTLHATLENPDGPLVDDGVWQCAFHLFAGDQAKNVDVSAQISVGADEQK